MSSSRVGMQMGRVYPTRRPLDNEDVWDERDSGGAMRGSKYTRERMGVDGVAEEKTKRGRPFGVLCLFL